MKPYETETDHRIHTALKTADTTKVIEIASGAMQNTVKIFKDLFDNMSAMIIADVNTYAAAGKQLEEIFRNNNLRLERTYIFDDPDLYAEMKYVDHLVEILSSGNAIAVAVGSGTINDLTKLASYRCKRQYMSVATAGSVDGYTAFGASITENSFKQTFFCPAPVAIVADLDVIAAAPPEMNAWGYADLMAKIPAGADWIIADALDVEPIDRISWQLVQEPLRKLISDPAGIQRREHKALCFLMEGLIMSGLAMQQAQSSRPASGAEHQFSHLWDNQHHKHNGKTPSHGFKVAIGSLASLALYETLIECLDGSPAIIEKSIDTYWPEFSEIEKEIRQKFADPVEAEQIIEQSRQKYVDSSVLQERVNRVTEIWPELKQKLRRQLLGFHEFKAMLQQVNAPVSPEDIGIALDRLKNSYGLARLIRKRYTVLDFANELGVFETCIDSIFNSDKYWQTANG
ncbi:MAG: sn-glycerol-1-phosphate dehydrogenase [Candidatus Neomarinimicrobiota bacterium]|nr:MAG: sn-glycerol-1-phosphate dehydrogenase [Candidatus Neomarinimicrobiota bacterium]